MRFNLVAVLGLTFMMGIMALALAIGGTMKSDGTADLLGVTGSGQMFDLEIEGYNCLNFESIPGVVTKYCPDDYGQPAVRQVGHAHRAGRVRVAATPVQGEQAGLSAMYHPLFSRWRSRQSLL